MASEYITKQTLKMFTDIVQKLINPAFKLPKGGQPVRVVSKALDELEKKFGALQPQRVVDYVVCTAYAYINRPEQWRITTVFGPKSLERLHADKRRIWHENNWLAKANITRATLLDYIIDKGSHPQAKFIYLPSEEQTKSRLLNTEVGLAICQTSTLGWTPLSPSCTQCKFTDECKAQTAKKFPELYRLRLQYGK